MTIVFVDGQPGYGFCTSCGEPDETRFGVCFDCADSGELRAAKRTAWQHLVKAMKHIRAGEREYARYCLSWALQRLTGTGDYRRGGYFDQCHPGFRS